MKSCVFNAEIVGLGRNGVRIGRRSLARNIKVSIHRYAHLPADRPGSVHRRIFDVAAKELGDGTNGKISTFGDILIRLARRDRLLLVTAQIR